MTRGRFRTMSTRGALTAVAIGAALLMTGCGIPLTSRDLPPKATSQVTIGPATSEAPPVPEPTWEAVCEPVDQDTLRYLEGQGNVGGAITFTRGAIVRVDDDRWEIAAETAVHPNGSGYTRDNVARVWFFEASEPAGSYEFVARKIGRSDAAVRCLGQG